MCFPVERAGWCTATVKQRYERVLGVGFEQVRRWVCCACVHACVNGYFVNYSQGGVRFFFFCIFSLLLFRHFFFFFGTFLYFFRHFSSVLFRLFSSVLFRIFSSDLFRPLLGSFFFFAVLYLFQTVTFSVHFRHIFGSSFGLFSVFLSVHFRLFFSVHFRFLFFFFFFRFSFFFFFFWLLFIYLNYCHHFHFSCAFRLQNESIKKNRI